MKTMKAAIYYGPGSIKYEEVPYPKCAADGVVLKMGACGVCNVMDVDAWYKWSTGGQGVGLARGHEWSGEIVEVGPRVKGFKVGDKIFQNPVFKPCFNCNYCFEEDYWRCINWRQGMAHRAIHGGFAEYLSIPFITHESAAILPDSLNWLDLAMIEPVYLGVGLAKKANEGETALIIGQELMGLSITAVMKERGVKVITTDISKKHREASEEAGADVVIDSLNEDVAQRVLQETKGHGADVAIVVDTKPVAFIQALSSVRRSGKVWLAAYYYSPFKVPPGVGPTAGDMTSWIGPGIAYTEPTIGFDPNFAHVQIAWGTLGERVPRWHEAAKLIQSGKISAKKHVSSIFPLEKTAEAFTLTAENHDEIKVMVQMQD
ncbi:MAG: alcohol dehydrogenase catalytic domain-containing protein [Spirochaetes bacterium]|nr:alcohol dehydrogenase catalytic domain-containing protein [Spirochaetota bacterium]